MIRLFKKYICKNPFFVILITVSFEPKMPIYCPFGIRKQHYFSDKLILRWETKNKTVWAWLKIIQLGQTNTQIHKHTDITLPDLTIRANSVKIARWQKAAMSIFRLFVKLSSYQVVLNNILVKHLVLSHFEFIISVLMFGTKRKATIPKNSAHKWLKNERKKKWKNINLSNEAVLVQFISALCM